MHPLRPTEWLHREVHIIASWLRHCRLHDPLFADLVQIQRRLGTPDEQAGDLDEARRIAHLLRNRLTGALPE